MGARCDMLNEMLQTEASISGDGLSTLTPEIVSAMSSHTMKEVSRREMIAFDDMQKLVTALKFWDDQTKRSRTGWMLGGLEDGGPDDLCYVDLSIYWTLRTHVSLLEACHFTNLVSFVKKVGELPGIIELISSGRLMPNMGEGYVYVGDDL